MKGTKDGQPREMFIYQVSDHEARLRRGRVAGHLVHGGRAAVAAAMLIADGRWDTGTMVNVEELDAEPLSDCST